MAAEPIPHDVTDDAFLGGAVHVLQPRTGYRAGIDAVLLAAAVPAAASRPVRVLDAGAGVGVAGLCLAARVRDAEVVLAENEAALVALATQNIARNAMTERARVIAADVTAPARVQMPLGLAPDHFDHVMANPPYGVEGRGRPPANTLRAAAHEMPGGELEIWLRFLARVVRPGGTATLVHRADALATLLAGLVRWFGDIAVLPLQPRAGAPAIRVIVQGTKASRAPLRLLPPLVLHAADGSFTPEVAALLRAPAPLDLGR